MIKKIFSRTAPGSKYFFTLILLLNCNISIAQQRLNMQGTAIVGNKELPKVLYIVPWKVAETVSLDTPAFNSILDEVFQPIERSAFQRELNYYDSLYTAPGLKP